MCKKFVVTGAILAVASFIIFGGSAFHHVTDGVGWVRDQVDESVPVEFKLERARKAIRAAEPKIREYNRAIAEKQVEIRYLEHELTKLKKDQIIAKARLREQWESLQIDRASYDFMGQDVSRNRMRRDADRRLGKVKAADQLINSKGQRLEALSTGLGHVRTALENLISKREELITQCETLEAKRRETEAKKAASLDFEVDDSDLARASEILAGVEKQLDVEIQVMENNRPLLGEDFQTEDDLIDVQDRIAAYLEGGEANESDLIEPVDSVPLIEAPVGTLTRSH